MKQLAAEQSFKKICAFSYGPSAVALTWLRGFTIELLLGNKFETKTERKIEAANITSNLVLMRKITMVKVKWRRLSHGKQIGSYYHITLEKRSLHSGPMHAPRHSDTVLFLFHLLKWFQWNSGRHFFCVLIRSLSLEMWRRISRKKVSFSISDVMHEECLVFNSVIEWIQKNACSSDVHIVFR